MALAILKFLNQENTHYRFDIDLGVNRYYTYSIGTGQTKAPNGLPQLTQIGFTSPLMGPLLDDSLGRTILEVLNQQFDAQNRFIQLFSFRTAERVGPALSEIVEIHPISISSPASALSFSAAMAMTSRPVETIPFQYRETQPVSSAMFLDAVRKVANAVSVPVRKTSVSAKVPSANGAMALGREMQLRRGRSLLSQPPNRPAQANGVATLEQPKASAALSIPSTNAVGKVVPANLAIEPELIALLQKVFTPETLKAIQSMSPEQALATITQGLMDISKSLPGSTGAAYSVAQALVQSGLMTSHSLGQGLSVGLAASTKAMEFQRIDAVQLKFTDTTTLMMNGRSRLLYRFDQAIAFPLTVETPRPISKGIVRLLVKHPETLEVLLEEKYRLENITTGALATVPTLSLERLHSLAPNQDYLVCVSLIWQATSSKTQQKKQIGTSLSQVITLVGEYSFDRIEGTAEVVPLNDVDRFRDYWHKVWEKEFAGMARRITLDCKYYLTLEPERTNHARMETVTMLEDDGSTRLNGKLKTGLIMSPYRLNELIPQISSHPSLSTAELAALMTPEFQQQCSYAARSAVEFDGKPGDVVGLWAYPEMKVQRVLLKQAGETNANGQVLALTEREVYFPIVAIVHFIGVGT